jgi:murein DD-endopeptidase MepM/ murein hydrolase activator NlpD
VLAIGSVAIALNAEAALAAATGEEALPMEERVFFDRDALTTNLRPLLRPSLDARDVRRAADRAPDKIANSPIKPGRGVAVAALHRGEPAPLPWAATPAVPPLLSQPPPKGTRLEAKLPVLRDAKRLALERALEKRQPDRDGGAHIFDRHERLSKSSPPPISRLPLQQMSTRWSDPLAALETDGEAAPEFIMPFANGRVTSLFNQGRRHPAIDLAGALGSRVLATTGAQKVVFAGRRGGYGNAVITQDAFGWTHLYGHLNSITSRVGQMLEQGQMLGHLGSTGHSTGPHVHYEVRDARGAHVNPVGLLFPRRSVGKGLAWADVGQFAASPQLASRTARADGVAHAHAIEKRPVLVTAKRKAFPTPRRAVRYAYRVRPTEWDAND